MEHATLVDRCELTLDSETITFELHRDKVGYILQAVRKTGILLLDRNLDPRESFVKEWFKKEVAEYGKLEVYLD